MVRKIYKKTPTTLLKQKFIFLFCSIFLATSFFSGSASAQCLTGTKYPTATFSPTCGSGTQTIVSDGWAGEYSVVNVVSGNTYTFTSGTTNSFITVGNTGGTLAYTFGTTPVTWTSTITGTVRFYTHTNSSCGTNFTDDIRSVSCSSSACTGTPTPGNTISSVTGACLATPFTLSLQNATIGSGVSFIWESADDLAFTVNVTTLSSATAIQTIASQTATKYYRCSVSCSGNTTISTPVFVTQNAPSACYCIPVSATGCNDGDVIARVVLNTLDNNSGTGCPSGVGGNGYSDYTATGIATNTTNLVAGNSYNCQVWAGQYDGNYAAWIDYNDDGVFATNERIGYTTTSVLGSNLIGVLGSSATFNITLSCNPTPGPHRLRVREQFNIAGSAITPCGSVTYSEIEDYIITILPPLPCPSPSSFTSNTPTINGATFTWNTGCVETDWVIEFGLPGFTAGTGTSIMATNDTTVVNTMTCGTTYDVYLRANCLTNGYSTYVGPISVTTLACPCTGNPASSNALSSVANACSNASFILSLDSTYSNVTGITYQWESSPVAAATWSPIFGATTNSYTLTSGVAIATDFRCVVTCSSSTLSTNSNPVSVGIAATPIGNTIIDPIIMSFTANAYSNPNNTANCFTSTYAGANAQASPDVYYRFVATACMDSADISICGAGWDTYLHLLDSTGTQIANNDDGCLSASVINVGGLIAGQTYYVVVEGWAANTGAYTLNVNLFDNPLVASTTISPSDIECEGTSMTFSGAVTGSGAGFSYNWSGPAPVTNATAFNVTFAHSGNYTMTVTDANGCTATTTLPILILQAPPITASVTTPICIGSSTSVVGGGAGVGGTYVWNNGAIDNVAFTPLTSGTTIYQVTGTDGYGCTATSSISLLVNAPATFNAPTTLLTTCPTNDGGSVAVSASSASTFVISPSASQPSSGVFTSMVGGTNYIVTLTDANSCTNTTLISATALSNGELAIATAANASSLPGNICGNMLQTDGSNMNYYGATCDDLIVTVVDGSGGNVLGNVNACVTVLPTVPTYNGQPYLPRYYDITPTNQGPAAITLYFTQDDFDDYNAAAGSYPQIPAVQATGTATFCISQVPGGFLPGASGATTIVHTVTATWNIALNRWEVTLPVTSFSGFYCHACNPLNSALPAAIANFKGTKTETTDLLTWSTTSELNNASFTVLYSNDGKNYAPLTTVNSKATSGNSNVVLNYSAENNMPKLGHNYYKLEQVDIDGKSFINTQVVDLMWGLNGSTISVYPNPTSNELNIDIYTTKAENSTIKILDMSGRILKEIQTKLAIGANSIQANIGEFATGIYTVQILENNKITQVSKIEKQ